MTYFIKHLQKFSLAIFFFVLLQISHAADFEMVILVHNDNPIEDISSLDLRKVWLGKKNNIDGVVINPVSAETQLNCKIVFYKSILNKSRNGLQKYYLREGIKGVIKKPQSVKNIDLLLFEVQTDTTAICFISKADLPDSLNVKILSVDGKYSSDKEYVIK